MHTPISTYRVQIHQGFNFQHLKELLPYLHSLGISTIYAAPLFCARKGSNHGYDGTDPDRVSGDIGTLQEWQELGKWLKEHQMTWLQDIVPNHMAYDQANVWLMDVFEKGKHSEYADFFDIDWNHPNPDLNGKVLAPFLGKEWKEVFAEGQLGLVYRQQQGFAIRFHEQEFPLAWNSYFDILNTIKGDRLPDGFVQLLDEFKSVKSQFQESTNAFNMMRHKESLFQLYVSDVGFEQMLEECVSKINKDLEQFKKIVSQQVYALAFNVVSDKTMNYRRFFVVNELICLKMEKEEVFKRYHQFVKGLIEQGLIQGLRVDHIDGLQDPKMYLERVRELAGPETYLIVEKILDSEEEMPQSWPIQGTSGYEFLSVVNHLFTKRENKEKMQRIWKDFTGASLDYLQLVQEKKRYMLQKRMGGELENLLALAMGASIGKTIIQDKNKLKEALGELLISFPVYRTYVDEAEVSQCDKGILYHVLKEIATKRPDLREEVALLKKILSEEGLQQPHNLSFLKRLQQFTGPLAAKGVEDTVFYIYNRLISHNEVGDSPKAFGISTGDFHQRMQERLAHLPSSLNALSTHDTKRGEDARARINVLAEIPDEWATKANEWKQINEKHKTKLDDPAPVPNDEYFIYQSLVGSFPIDGVVTDEFAQRTKDFMLKALREAKVYTDYPDFNTAYEEATLKFISTIVKDEEFLGSFLPFFEKVSRRAMVFSLGQTLVKITAPGIPDTYQGSELWETSYVDPDNRRKVDFHQRQHFLQECLAQQEKPTLVVSLRKVLNTGKIKLYLTQSALRFRLQNTKVFEKGMYIPLQFSGPNKEMLVGYARHFNGKWALTVVARETSAFSKELLPEAGVWEDTFLLFPMEVANCQNVFTGKVYAGNQVNIEELLSGFPVALLEANSSYL